MAHSIQIIKQHTFIANEIPTGDINGINKDFVLSNTPVVDSVIVRLNGIVQVPGSLKDYTIIGNTISFIKSPSTGQEVAVAYFTE